MDRFSQFKEQKENRVWEAHGDCWENSVTGTQGNGQCGSPLCGRWHCWVGMAAGHARALGMVLTLERGKKCGVHVAFSSVALEF